MRVTLWRSEGEIVVGTFGAARVCSNGRSGCECDRKDASKKKTCHDEVFFFSSKGQHSLLLLVDLVFHTF